MKRFGVLATSIATLCLAVGTMGGAEASTVQYYKFTTDFCTGGCGSLGQGSTTNDFGTVKVTDNGTGALDFLVTLNSPLNFVGGGIDATFAFGLDLSGVTITAITPAAFSNPGFFPLNISSGTLPGASFAVDGANVHEDGAGTFGNGPPPPHATATEWGYGIDYKPNGGTSGITTLAFSASGSGLSISDLIQTDQGYWFVADVASISGLGGTGNTGAVGAVLCPTCGPGPGPGPGQTPLPGTLPLLISGIGGMAGLLSWRRKKRAAQV